VNNVEALTKAENVLLTYLFYKYQNGCYEELEAKGN